MEILCFLAFLPSQSGTIRSFTKNKTENIQKRNMPAKHAKYNSTK